MISVHIHRFTYLCTSISMYCSRCKKSIKRTVNNMVKNHNHSITFILFIKCCNWSPIVIRNCGVLQNRLHKCFCKCEVQVGISFKEILFRWISLYLMTVFELNRKSMEKREVQQLQLSIALGIKRWYFLSCHSMHTNNNIQIF